MINKIIGSNDFRLKSKKSADLQFEQTFSDRNNNFL